MAIFIGRVESAARVLLADAGVRILGVGSPDHDDVMVDVIGAGTQDGQGRLVAEPPADEDAAREGMGAWHVNNVNEFQTVLSGTGIVEFWTQEGPVAVQVGEGDVMAIERAEHRYRPLTRQEWALRFAGYPDVAPVTTDTGRASLAWPTP